MKHSKAKDTHMNQVTVSNQSVKLIEKNGKLYASSLELAEKLGRDHKGIVKIITDAIFQKDLEHKKRGPKSKIAGELKFLSESEISEHKEFGRLNFQPTSYQDSTGRTLKSYEMSRDGLSYVIMKCSGPKAAIWRIRYINMFNKMECLLREKQSEEWKKARVEGKGQRREFTDALKALQKTAVEQGSQTYKEKPQLLYSTYTNMVYSKLFPDMKDKKNLREQLSSYELTKLSMLEQTQAAFMQALIRNGITYKEVLPECKRYADDYRDILDAKKRASLLS